GQIVQGAMMRTSALTRLLLPLAVLACLQPLNQSLAAEPAVSPAGHAPNTPSPRPVMELSLAQAWHTALKHDPGHQAAISEREAGQANRAIGRAGLLPQVSASLGRSKLRGTLETPSQTGAIASQDLDYTIKTNEIRATQSVLN